MRYLLLMLMGLSLAGQPNPNQLSIDWLVREDIFAGMLDNDHVRMAKGEQTLDSVGRHYPEPSVLAWRYAAEMVKAVWAHEAKDSAGFNRHFGLALTYLNQCRRGATGNMAALPEIFEGAVTLVMADRLPEGMRKGAWERSYQAYTKLEQMQLAGLENMPLHMKGELLAGLATTSFKTGREEELKKALERIQLSLAKTPYASVAKKWADEPGSREKVKLACLSCHEPNRLGSRVERSHRTQ